MPAGESGQDKTLDRKVQEWQQCFTLLDKYEDRLDAVRRYGFTFIAALLSANALLGEVNGTVIPLQVKLAVMWVAAFLLLILFVLDRDYQLYQSAIGKRAKKLEEEKDHDLGMGLETAILEEYVKYKMWRFILALYYGFEGVVLILGLAITWGNGQLEFLAILGPLVAIALIYAVEPTLNIPKPEKTSQ